MIHAVDHHLERLFVRGRHKSDHGGTSTVGEHHRLPGPQTAYHHRVMGLVALDGHRRPHGDAGEIGDEVNGERHRLSRR